MRWMGHIQIPQIVSQRVVSTHERGSFIRSGLVRLLMAEPSFTLSPGLTMIPGVSLSVPNPTSMGVSQSMRTTSSVCAEGAASGE